jgi:hypothetical protein
VEGPSVHSLLLCGEKQMVLSLDGLSLSILCRCHASGYIQEFIEHNHPNGSKLRSSSVKS